MNRFFAEEKQRFDREVNLPDEWFPEYGLLSYVTPAYYYRRDLDYVTTDTQHPSGELMHIVMCDDPIADDFGTYYYTMHI